jgi:hypothetical protein
MIDKPSKSQNNLEPVIGQLENVDNIVRMKGHFTNNIRAW